MQQGNRIFSPNAIYCVMRANYTRGPILSTLVCINNCSIQSNTVRSVFLSSVYRKRNSGTVRLGNIIMIQQQRQNFEVCGFGLKGKNVFTSVMLYQRVSDAVCRLHGGRQTRAGILIYKSYLFYTVQLNATFSAKFSLMPSTRSHLPCCKIIQCLFFCKQCMVYITAKICTKVIYKAALASLHALTL